MHWQQYTKNQLASELGVNLESGLTEEEAKNRLLAEGANLLMEKEPDSYYVIFFRQFKSPLIYILMICAAMVFSLKEYTDAIIIFAVLVLNAVIGVIQEGRSGRVLQSLKKLSQTDATVIRDGQEVILPEKEVVRGDLLVLQEGQKVAADARVIFGSNLGVDESALTGESGMVLKKDMVLELPNLPIAETKNMVFKGTPVLTGNGRAIVVGTGMHTEIGKISQALLQDETEIPLQKNVRLLSQAIVYFILFISIALFALGISAGKSPREMFSLVVSLAVSIIPEGLPLVLTVILAHGVWRMSKKNALVKKLQAVESLGQAKVLALDKTGTVTENQMTVVKANIGGKIYEVTGNGYEPKGSALFLGQVQQGNADLNLAATISCLATNAYVVLDEATGQYRLSGDPTEAAMVVFAEKLGFFKNQLLKNYVEAAEIPFNYKNKYRAVFYEHQSGIFCGVTGAPEVVFKHSEFILQSGQARAKTQADHKLLETYIENFSSLGLRVVAFGYKNLEKDFNAENIDSLIFGGLFGIADEIRPEAKQAIALAGASGLKVVMVTGDHKTTAIAVASQVGIYQPGDLVVTGADLENSSVEELAGQLNKVSVFARVTPENKMKIIQAYKHAGLVVAMTGDGVNDAPSLVAADLGVAMGKIGTEVAKEAADIILLDDNLFSIVTAVDEGRVMYQNIKKSLQFLFSTSLGELFTIVAALLFGLPLPVSAVQILWLNLITDPLSGAALALEKGEREVIGRNGKFVHNKFFIDWRMSAHMLMVGIIMAAGALYLYNLYEPLGSVKASTIALTALAAFQWYNSFNCRFLQRSILGRQVLGNYYIWGALFLNFILQIFAVYNPTMNRLLHTEPLKISEWVAALGLALVIILADEARKFGLRIWDKNTRLSPLAK